MLGVEHGGAITSSIDQMIAPGGKGKSFGEIFKDLIGNESLGRKKIVLRRADGETFPAEIFGVRIGRDAYQVTIRNATDRISLVDDLVHSQKMESIGTLAGGIAHDFNNLLAAIMGYSSLLEQMAEKRPEAAEAVGAILQATRSAKELTGQLLAFARRGKYRLRHVDMGELLGNLVDILSRSTGPAVTIRTNLPPDKVVVMGDHGQISGALMNLLINARDALEKGGTIRISLKTRIFSRVMRDQTAEIDPGHYALVEIADDGPGIPPDILPRIFEPYFTTKDKEKGTGLGLAVVDGVVAHHDGHVAVATGKGRGTTFRVYLPLADSREEVRKKTAPAKKAAGKKPRAAPAPKAKKPAADRKKPARKDLALAPKSGAPPGARVLVAEDEPMVRDFCTTVLKKMGFEVFAAQDGREALEIFQEKGGDFDLVLMDMIMPRMSGEVAFRKMRAMRPDIKVLLSSGFSEDTIAQNLFTQGAAGFIEKPYDIPQLIREVKRILEID